MSLDVMVDVVVIGSVKVAVVVGLVGLAPGDLARAFLC